MCKQNSRIFLLQCELWDLNWLAHAGHRLMTSDTNINKDLSSVGVAPFNRT
jgi:hypothetical protein